MSSGLSRRRFLALAGGVAFAGAGAVAAGRAPERAAASTTTAVASPVPSPDRQLLLRMEITGGLVPSEFRLTELPAFSLYADGRAVTVGPQIEIFPQPALPNLRELRLTPAGIDAVLTAAKDAGLLAGDKAYSNTMVADAPSTIFTTVVDGRTERVSAAALGIGEEMLPAGPERDARAQLLAFRDLLMDLAGRLPADAIAAPDAAYPLERLRIYARPIDPNNPPWAGSGLEQQPVAWPLETPLASIGDPTDRPDLDGAMRCAELPAADTKRLLPALQGANQLTPWESDGVLYQLWVRPLLPDETGC